MRVRTIPEMDVFALNTSVLIKLTPLCINPGHITFGRLYQQLDRVLASVLHLA